MAIWWVSRSESFEREVRIRCFSSTLASTISKALSSTTCREKFSQGSHVRSTTMRREIGAGEKHSPKLP
ncbi:hypothetical protein TIFTF001_050936 [Ficus carica]|uniref:Uncharacterized protein n=1 Tax=Ficus carica TaxID=3494 RepID=A0AA87YWL3_FICCA|nr:hypothetical protein TIFTF001_050928 [Ficus carica]GMN19467.1 hypothetical protein TIFTF001_050930 [Ficus carica]GMN19481.1 hypothetical protein TIFTF001_050934 [Ficus carica]GMN19500.1 hypothetical protein TIFTF001_050936 [Ficus carica]